jgi:hypothetical protein
MVEKERPLEPQESEFKCYRFTATATATIKGFVWAKNPIEAELLVHNREYEEIVDTELEEVIDVEDLEEF